MKRGWKGVPGRGNSMHKVPWQGGTGVQAPEKLLSWRNSKSYPPWTEEEGKIMPDPSHRGQGIFSEMTSERCCLIHGLMQCLLNFAIGDFKHMLFY